MYRRSSLQDGYGAGLSVPLETIDSGMGNSFRFFVVALVQAVSYYFTDPVCGSFKE